MAHGGVAVPVTPDVLRWARETAGMSVEEVAKALKTDEATVNQWERGGSRPSLGVARHLAEVYRRPMASFLLPSRPTELAAPADFRVGSAKGLLNREVRLAIRKAQRLQAIAAEIFASLDIVPNWGRGTTRLDADPESLAAKTRLDLGVRLDQQVAWKDEREAFNAWRALLGTSGVLVLQDAMPLDEVRGFSLTSDGPPTIVVNSGDPFVHSRIFTIFHELGHYLLGLGGICLPEPGGGTASLSTAEENFCNRLSGAVLIPPEDFVANFNSVISSYKDSADPAGAALKHLATRYRVSRQVAWYRLRTLGLIDEKVFRERWLQWSGALPVRQRAGRAPKVSAIQKALSEKGSTFVATILEAERRQSITLADAVDFLDIKTGDVPKLAERVAGAKVRFAQP